jgi:hypothetical protein
MSLQLKNKLINNTVIEYRKTIFMLATKPLFCKLIILLPSRCQDTGIKQYLFCLCFLLLFG